MPSHYREPLSWRRLAPAADSIQVGLQSIGETATAPTQASGHEMPGAIPAVVSALFVIAYLTAAPCHGRSDAQESLRLQFAEHKCNKETGYNCLSRFFYSSIQPLRRSSKKDCTLPTNASACAIKWVTALLLGTTARIRAARDSRLTSGPS